MKLLTIIIPFLNEKEEVLNTLDSVFKTANKNLVDVILINDASDDGYDYDSIAEKFSLFYIKLEKRSGVAKCRDFGVEKCNTPYFLFLDAHMRFYDCNWSERIIEQLENNKKILLCCDTISLHFIEDKLERDPDFQSYGAAINFYDNKTTALLNPVWNFKKLTPSPSGNTYQIPCVLGAGYACNKEYWMHLKGLEGLKFYGLDETYISMKVWLEGGQCILDKNIKIGHIYRNQNRPTPYTTTRYFYYYNCLLVSLLLLPDNLNNYVFSNCISSN